MDNIKIMALGGLDEDGRNMLLIEINNKILIIDCGLKYPEASQLGVECIICDFQYLLENRDRVVGIIITHGHDDVVGGLPYLLKVLNIPVFATPFTICLINDLIKEHKLKDIKLNRIKRKGVFNVDGIKIRSFSLTHSMCDQIGLAIETKHGYIVYASEYIMDFDISRPAFSNDINEISEIGKKGVFALLTESKTAARFGFTSPNHRTKDTLLPLIEKANGRVFVTLYQQNIFRLLEVLDCAIAKKRPVFFVNEYILKLVNYLSSLKYYTFPKKLILSADQLQDRQDVIVIVAEQGPKVFRLMQSIASRENTQVSLCANDLVIVASPVIQGCEKEASSMEDELYKEGVKVISLSRQKYYTMHPSCEDLKMMISLLKPKYYIPIKGGYRFLLENANIALEKGYLAHDIIVLDNGQIAEFIDGKFNNSANYIKAANVLIDGQSSLDSLGLIMRDRQILANEGAIIIGVVLDFKTKKIIGGPDVQSRGVIYLKDANDIIEECGKILESVIDKAREENRYDNIECRNNARELVNKFIFKRTGKKPIVLPVISEINLSEGGI